MKFEWTDEATDLAENLWRDGLSGSDNAAKLGITRSAVMGKLHRLGLTGDKSKEAKEAVKKPRQGRTYIAAPKLAPEPVTAPVAAPATADEYDATALNITLLELTSQTCKWPVNSGGPFLFCGHQTASGSSYCEHHEKRSRGQGTAAERAAGKMVAA